MKKFEVCVVIKQYHYFEVEADNEAEAREEADYRIGCNYVANREPDDYDTEIFVEREIEKGVLA